MNVDKKMKLITVNDICEMLSVKKSTVYVWAKSGDVPCFRINGMLRFDLEEIHTWIRTCKTRVLNVRTSKTHVRNKSFKNTNIDQIIKKAIEGTCDTRYNERQRETGPESGPSIGKEVDDGTI